MLITIQPVEQTLTQSIFSFTHENQDYFFMVGDQEVIGTTTQEVNHLDIRWFQGRMLVEFAPDLSTAREIAKVRDKEREDF